MANTSLHKGFGAIGSERKTRVPEPTSTYDERPPSWHDEVGSAAPRVTNGAHGLFDIDTACHQRKTHRAISFPENAADNPQLAPLTHARTNPYPAYHGDVRSQQMSPPPSAHHARIGWNVSSPRTADTNASIQASARSPLDNRSTYARTPLSGDPTRDIGYQLSPASSNEQDYLTSTFGNMQLKSKTSGYSERPTHRPSTNSGLVGRPSFTAQRPLLDEGLAMIRNIKTPSPTSASADEEWRPYHHDPIGPEAIAAARQEMMRNPQYAEEVRRYGQTLLNIAEPNHSQDHSTPGLGQLAARDRRSPEELTRRGSDTEFSFRNRALAGGTTWPYAEDFRVQHIGQPPKPENTYIVVVFKLHRAAIYYRPEDMVFASDIKAGDMIVVQADRGEDIGIVWRVCNAVLDAEEAARHLNTEHLHNLLSFVKAYRYSAARLQRYQLPTNYGQELVYKSIVRKAGSHERSRLMDKEHDETKAKRIAEQKARERGLPMEILDAEFQADHGKLTIYYISEQYVVFKEFVDDMYKVYKMRVWMSSVNQVKPGR